MIELEKRKNMIKIGITGNIASGKSQAEKILAGLNYKVIDADEINKNIIENDKQTQKEIIKAFSGYNILDENLKISKEKLGYLIFSNSDKKKRLEQIMHKKIFFEIEKFINSNKEEKIIFISMALLFETKQESKFDKIIFISAPENIRLNRLIKRNNLSENEALKRINSQKKEEEKIKKSDYVIYNNSDLDNFEKQLQTVLKDLINLYLIGS